MLTVNPDDEMHSTLRFIFPLVSFTQPIPLDVSLIHVPGGLWSLVRTWRDGDPQRCGLCPSGQCVARNGFCHMVIPRADLTLDQAALLSTIGLPR
jgi:hypothetical protein